MTASHHLALGRVQHSLPLVALIYWVTACSGDAPPAGSATDGSGGIVGSGGIALSSGGVTTGGASPAGGIANAGGSASVGGSGGVGGAIAAGGNPASGGAGIGGTVGPSGGSGAGGAPAKAATWAEIAYMLNAGCASCHSAPSPLNLRPVDDPSSANPALYTALTTHKVAQCGGLPLVTPGDPSASAWLKLLNAECTKAGEPFFMPETCGLLPCFPSDWMSAITLWVEAGAPTE